jgi:small subunit ribosomal protein S7
MSRRHSAEKRIIIPEMRYNSVLLSRFINNVMKDGKKKLAEKIVYSALSKIEKKYKVGSFETFSLAMQNVKPYLEVISVRVGGANYQVPSRVAEERGEALACRWIILKAITRSEKSMDDKLAEEIYEASNNRGAAVKKKEDTHKMAEANKAFSHLNPKMMQAR